MEPSNLLQAIAASRAALPLAVAIWFGCVECRSDIGPTACDLATFPARPLTKVWEGWGRGGGCVIGMQLEMEMLLRLSCMPAACTPPPSGYPR